MSFSDRNYLFRKSEPSYKSRTLKEPHLDDQERSNFIKRRGTSLARTEVNRQSSFNTSGIDQSSKRNSVLDPLKLESGNTGGGKLINFIKSGLSLSKFKSRSKINLQESRNSTHDDYFLSKSEESLAGFQLENYFPPIRVSNLILNDCDPTLYMDTPTSEGYDIYKSVVELNKECIIQPVHPSIVNGQNFCFQIIKRKKSTIPISPLYTSNDNSDAFSTSQISKSCSYNSPFQDVRSDARGLHSVNIIRCLSASQRNEWMMRLKKHINPKIDHTVRHEDILRICIQEAKNLLPKKRYFCEIRLDQVLYGRTTVKTMNEMIFWGEEFEFIGLEKVCTISVSIFKVVDTKKKTNKPEIVALLNLSCNDVNQNSFTEKWYSPSLDVISSSDNVRFSQPSAVKTNNLNINVNSNQVYKGLIDSTPMLRIRARYRPLQILPTRYYQPLIDYIIQENIDLVMSLENHLKVKSKEEFVNTLLMILQIKKRHTIFLSDIIVMEVYKSDDNLVLRGNTMASKAMESYLKIVGEKYIMTILSDLIDIVTSKEIDCEVDPLKIHNLKDHSLIINNQKKLLRLVEGVWSKICSSSYLFPDDLKSIFFMIRKKISVNNRSISYSSHMIDQVISSCLFLRFICPAIMSPFLFGLSTEYSDKPCINRTFTLVAKCIQSLANFSQSYQGKEAYMGFLHDFLIRNTNRMRYFLKEISVRSPFESNDYFADDQSDFSFKTKSSADLGYKFAELSYQLNFYLKEIPIKDYTPTMVKARSILDSLSNVFPKRDVIDSECSSKSSSYNNFRSQIPISTYRRKSTTSLKTEKSLLLNLDQCSPNIKADIDEDFSYIPNKYSSNYFTFIDGTQKLYNENYVAFESIELKGSDQSGFNDMSSPTSFERVKGLTENEINNCWSKIVTESYNNSIKGKSVNSCVINSPCYESIYQPCRRPGKPGIQSKSVQRIFSQNLVKRSENLNIIPTIAKTSKLASTSQTNLYRKIKRNSSMNNPLVKSRDFELLPQTKESNPTLTKNASYGELDSLGNLSGSGSNSLHSSKSMSSICQKIKFNNETYFNEDSDQSNSKEDLNGSKKELFHRSSQSFSGSISSNIDLDSFLSNELIRLQLFFEYFNVLRPSDYEGSTVGQYKCKVRDEYILKEVWMNKSKLNQCEIKDYMKAAYRLLKSINKPGQIPAEFVLKSVMEISKKIQLSIKEECDKVKLSTNGGVKTKSNSKILKGAKTKSDAISLSTQSLPSPLSKNQKNYMKKSPILVRSREANSTINLKKNLTECDVFDYC